MLIDIKTNKEVFLPRNASIQELANTREILCPSRAQHHSNFFQLQTRARIKESKNGNIR